jgi:hypothetical protein
MNLVQYKVRSVSLFAEYRICKVLGRSNIVNILGSLSCLIPCIEIGTFPIEEFVSVVLRFSVPELVLYRRTPQHNLLGQV